jgi:hypothetical protein
MSASLYEMSQGFNNIFDLVMDETMDLSELEGALQSIEADVSIKVSNGIGLIRSLESYSAGMKVEEERLSKNRRAIDNRVKSIKSWYQQNLEQMGKSKIVTERGTMAVQNNPPALQVDEVKLPDLYYDIVPQHLEVNKDRIKADLKAGKTIPGAYFTQGKSLRIR